MVKRIPHVGPRMVKTAIAVALALFLANLRGTETPIFAAIGAISAVSRTLGDALHSCFEQFAGLLLGAAFGWAFVTVFADFRYIGLALGILALIFLCVLLGLRFAVPLSCIVFVSICLAPAAQAIPYSVNRLIDTSIGLGVGFVINTLIRPYNNRAQISRLFADFLHDVPELLEARVLRGDYPDLTPLRDKLQRIGRELDIFEKQHILRSRYPEHHEQVTYLRGCQQLAQALLAELSSLCSMDENGALDAGNAAQLLLIGLPVPDEPPRLHMREADTVMNYHLRQLLMAYHYLGDFNLME